MYVHIPLYFHCCLFRILILILTFMCSVCLLFILPPLKPHSLHTLCLIIPTIDTFPALHCHSLHYTVIPYTFIPCTVIPYSVLSSIVFFPISPFLLPLIVNLPVSSLILLLFFFFPPFPLSPSSFPCASSHPLYVCRTRHTTR